MAVDTSTFISCSSSGVIVRRDRGEPQLWAQFDHIVVTDHSTGAVWELLLEHKVRLDEDSLSDGSGFDLHTCGGLPFQVDGLLINRYRHGFFVFIRLGVRRGAGSLSVRHGFLLAFPVVNC